MEECGESDKRKFVRKSKKLQLCSAAIFIKLSVGEKARKERKNYLNLDFALIFSAFLHHTVIKNVMFLRVFFTKLL